MWCGRLGQVWLIERYVTDLAGTPVSAVAALGVTNLQSSQATPLDIARLVRNHWGVESLHWLRDTVDREDHSRAHSRSGPRVMAGLRNLAIGALHLVLQRQFMIAVGGGRGGGSGWLGLGIAGGVAKPTT